MSSPLGHGLAGLVVYTLAKRFRWIDETSGPATMLLFSGLAALPDLDIVFNELLHAQQWFPHRTYTHSLFFALLLGLIVAWWLCRAGRVRNKNFYWLLPLTIATHPLMDMCCVEPPGKGGVELFLPFSHAAVYTPLFFMRSIGSYVGWGEPEWLAVLKVVTIELIGFGVLFLGLYGLFYLWDRIVPSRRTLT